MKPWAAVVGLALALAGARVEAFEWGTGVTAGASFPLAQSDNASGVQFGVRVPLNVVPLLTLEPFLTSTSLGGVEATFAGQTYNRRGFDVLGWGARAALGGVGLGPRFRLYPFVGVGSYHWSREGSPGSTDVGYTIGAGWARRLPWRLVLDLRTDFTWIHEGATARRFMGIAAGVTVPLRYEAPPAAPADEPQPEAPSLQLDAAPAPAGPPPGPGAPPSAPSGSPSQSDVPPPPPDDAKEGA